MYYIIAYNDKYCIFDSVQGKLATRAALDLHTAIDRFIKNSWIIGKRLLINTEENTILIDNISRPVLAITDNLYKDYITNKYPELFI